jgi:hypothetical protein
MSTEPQNEFSLGEKLKVAFDGTKSDKGYNLIKGAIGCIPSVGSLVVGFLDSFIAPPATERMRNFLENLVGELEEVKSKNELVNFENPVFQTTFMQACQIAVRTHKEQKLEALRNIVINSSIPQAVEDDILAMFLNWIDGFTALHISTLKHLHYLNSYAPGQLDTYFPMLEENAAIYNQVLKDLADKGLINLIEDYITEEDKGDMYWRSLVQTIPTVPVDFYIRPEKSEENLINIKTVKRQENIYTLLRNCSRNPSSPESRTTKLGKQFIAFIEYPSIQTEPI